MMFRRWLYAFLSLCICILLQLDSVESTHITGTFSTKEFFRFLIKFGFQKTDRHRQKDTSGYIFGNITSKMNFSVPITLAVLDRSHFLEYYGNRTVIDKNIACTLMFNTLNQSSYDPNCNDEGQDFLRYVNYYLFVHIYILQKEEMNRCFYIVFFPF